MIRKPRSIKKTTKVSKFSFLLGILVFLIFLFLPGQNIYQTTWQISRPAVADVPLALPAPAPYPVNFSGVSAPILTSRGVLLIDLASGVTIFEKNKDLQLFPASITKVMTALVGLDAYKLDDILEVKTFVSDGKVMGLTLGEKMTFENLLYAALVDSANDAAYAIADNYSQKSSAYSGGLEKFIEKMNQKAKDLKMEKTHFTNPIGFEDENHYSTALDLSRLSISALQNPKIAQIVGISTITVPNADFSKFYKLENVNSLLGKVPGVLGLKTGWTEKSGECLVTVVTRNNQKVLFIVLGSADRFGETQKLIDWVFNNFSWQKITAPKPDR